MKIAREMCISIERGNDEPLNWILWNAYLKRNSFYETSHRNRSKRWTEEKEDAKNWIKRNVLMNCAQWMKIEKINENVIKCTM